MTPEPANDPRCRSRIHAPCKTFVVLPALSLAAVGILLLACGYFRGTLPVEAARDLLFWQAPQVYSFVHGRPLELCTTYQEDRARVAVESASSAAYHHAARTVLTAPCRGDWAWLPGQMAGHLYAQIARDLPYAWLFARTAQSEIAIALLLMISAACGAAALPYLAWRASGSLGVATATVLSAVLVAYAVPSPAVGESAAYKMMLAFSGFAGSALLILLLRSPIAGGLAKRFACEGLLVGFACLQFLLYLFVARSAALMFVFAFVLLAILIALATANRRALVRSFAVLLVLGVPVWDYLTFSAELLSPISGVNFAAGGSFAPLALASGFWTERPNTLSIPLGDYGVFLGWAVDPLLGSFQPSLIEYQSYVEYGKLLLKTALFSHPLEFIEHAALRLFRKIYFLEYLATYLRPLGAPFFLAIKVLLTAALACLLVAALRRKSLVAVVPVLAVPVFGFYATDLLTHTVHTHTAYFDVGLTQLLILAPVVVALGAGAAMRASPAVVGLIVAAKRRRLRAAHGLALAGLTVAALASIPVARLAAREVATFRLFYYPWLGVHLGGRAEDPMLQPLRPAELLEKIGALNEQYPPGAASMFGLWLLRKYANPGGRPPYVLPTDSPGEGAEMRALTGPLFERALREAPNNPWIPPQALMIYEDPRRAAPVFKRALEVWPDHPLGGYMAAIVSLVADGPERARYAQLFERHVHDFLRKTAHLRPGFQAVPVLQGEQSSSVAEEGLELTLPADGLAVFGPAQMHRSNRLDLLFYARILSGAATARLWTETEDREDAAVALAASDALHYRKLAWSGSPSETAWLLVQAGAQGARLVVRDFYPLPLAPRAPRRQ